MLTKTTEPSSIKNRYAWLSKSTEICQTIEFQYIRSESFDYIEQRNTIFIDVNKQIIFIRKYFIHKKLFLKVPKKHDKELFR